MIRFIPWSFPCRLLHQNNKVKWCRGKLSLVDELFIGLVEFAGSLAEDREIDAKALHIEIVPGNVESQSMMNGKRFTMRNTLVL